MKYKVVYSNRFLKSFKLVSKQGKDMSKLRKTIDLLANGETLPPRYDDHKLTGKYSGYRECHIEPDWLLIYTIINDELILYIFDTGSHSELFG